MLELAAVVAAAMGVIALAAIAFNWGALIVNLRRQKQDQASRISPIFLVPQLFLATAFLLLSLARIETIPGSWLVLAGLADCGLWALVWHLFRHGFGKPS